MTSPLRFPLAVPPASESKLRGRTYASGFSDALGERLLAHGPGDEPVLEVLEFNQALSDSPDFEKALRARFDVLRAIKHTSIAAIHSIERPDGMGLCLVSEHIEGRRLSELTPANLGPAFALNVIRTVTPVLCVLNQAGVGVAHGALSAERIVVAADGRLVVVEQVLGWALESLRFSRQQLNELGIVAGTSDPVRFDGRTDMIQLGFLALSLFLRRRLDPADCPVRIPALLDGSAEGGALMLPARLRVWLERALQVGPKPFKSAHEAADELDELSDDAEVPLDESDALLEFPSEDGPDAPAPPLPPATIATPATSTKPVASTTPHTPAPSIKPVAPPLPPPAPREIVKVKAPDPRPAPVPASAPAPEAPVATSVSPTLAVDRLKRLGVWVLVAVSLIAMGEAIALVFLSYNQRPAEVSSTPSPQNAAPDSTRQPAANPQTATGAAGAAGGASTARTVPPDPATAERRPAPARVFQLTITSALQLQVFADGKLAGTTPLTTNLREGTRQLEVVNEALEFRQTQTVQVGSGQPRAIRIAVPNGHINVNATPWAEVTIDGVAVGQTPIANYSLPIGRHEIVFRHPQLGMRRQSIVVKAVTPLRVTEAFQR